MREIGNQRALGLLRWGVIGLFVLEGVLMGGLGGILGAALGDFAAREELSPLYENIDPVAPALEAIRKVPRVEDLPNGALEILVYGESQRPAIWTA